MWAKFHVKIRGHIQYYGIYHNLGKIDEFIYQAIEVMFKWLNLRSQKRSFHWDQFNKLIKKFLLPKGRVVHTLL